MYSDTVSSLFACTSFSSGYICFKISSSTSCVTNTFELSCISCIPGSQNILRIDTFRILISPKPLSLSLSQKQPNTPVPSIIFCQLISEYTSSKSFCSSTRGIIELRACASALSLSSLGRQLNVGYAAIASACFPNTTFHSHAEGALIDPGCPLGISTVLFLSFHHCWSAMILFSRFAFPALYFFRISVALFTCCLPIFSFGKLCCSGTLSPGISILLSSKLIQRVAPYRFLLFVLYRFNRS